MVDHSDLSLHILNRGSYLPLFFMDENDLKLLISAYQTKTSELLSQLISSEARVLKSQQIIEALQKQIQELSSNQNTFDDVPSARKKSTRSATS